MEEDIDIEEHDVLDNPRIRDMFPDLSRVKTEAPDPDLEPDLDDPHFEEYDQVNDRIEFEDYSEFDNVESAASFHYMHYEKYVSHDPLPPEDTHHFNNKIILGTKPNTEIYETAELVDNSDNYNEIKKENLPAQVLLDNWGDRLNNSTCYCKECEILFATENALDAHKMTAHSFLVAISVNKAIKSTTKSAVSQVSNVARKSTGKPVDSEKFCNHCNKYFIDGTALIKHLYELLPPKNLNQDSPIHVPKKNDPITGRFKCNVCDTLFPNYNAATMHRKRNHPEHNRLRVISKIDQPESEHKQIFETDSKNVTVYKHRKKVTTLDKIKHTNKKVKSIKKDLNIHIYQYCKGMTIKNPPIPKSVLYKCQSCDIHFVSVKPAFHHMRQCNKVSPYTICNLCNMKISGRDSVIHKLQHNYTDNFNIYKIDFNLYTRLLCKCPRCGVCSNEVKFWLHWKEGCQEAKWKCETCHLDLPKSTKCAHRRLHRMKKYTREDFVLVEFSWKDTKKRKHENNDNEIPAAKKIKTINAPTIKTDKFEVLKNKRTDKFSLSYCTICECCFHRNHWRSHLGSNCRKNIKHPCKTCGLMFTKKSIFSHREFHKEKKVTIHDFKFLWKDSTPVVPAPPDYYKCRKCHVQYLGLYNRSHDCAKAYKTCYVCNKTYELNAYKLHIEFHKYGQNNALFEFVKYESLNKMWNIIYSCEDCKINTDSYDKSVEHSQNHFNNIANIGIVRKECAVCKLKFDETCFTKHQQLHKELPINLIDFLILKYKHEKLMSDDWFQLFGKLPQQKIQQIVSSSMYRYTRQVKMTLAKNGQPESTLYMCKRCNTCVDPKAVIEHVFTTESCKQAVKRYVCSECQLFFYSFNLFNEHKSHHVKGANDSFRIITFNDEYDVIINNTLKSAWKNKRMIEKKKDKLKSNINLPDGTEKRKVYKCTRCKLNLTSRTNVVQHRCNDHRKVQCNICGLVYNAKFRKPHEILHEKYPKLRKKNIKIHLFNPLHSDKGNKVNIKNYIKTGKTINKSQGYEKRENKNIELAKVYKCPCGLHFTSVQTIQKHIEMCTPGCAVSKENCSKCGLLFPTDVLVSHLCKHHSRNTKIHIEVVRIVRIYECSDCNLLFNNKYELSKHYYDCDAKNGVKCKTCGLLFHSSTIKSHVSKHTIENLGTVLNKTVKIYKNDANTSELRHILYKCSKCNIHNLYLKSLQHHFDYNHRIVRGIVTCNICGLNFNKMSIENHIKRDHKYKNYSLEIRDPLTNETFVVNEYTKPSSNKKVVSLDTIALKTIPSNVPDAQELDSVTEADTLTTSRSKHVVYRCAKCNIHNVHIESWKSHVQREHRLSKTESCELCGLRFHKLSMPRHITRDHTQEKFRIVVKDPVTKETFIVTEYTPILKSENKSLDNEFTDNRNSHTSETNTQTLLNVESRVGSVQTEDTSDINTDILMDTTFNNENNEIQENYKDSTVYRCSVCDIHNVQIKSWNSHVARKHKILMPILKCELCGLKFIKKSIDSHIQHSHSKNKFRITVVDLLQNKTFIVTNNTKIDDMKDDTQNSEIVQSRVTVNMETDNDKNNGEDLDTSTFDVTTFKERVPVETTPQSQSNESLYIANTCADSTMSESFGSDKEAGVVSCTTSSIENKVKLFKCGACNVYFLTQTACYKHTQKHVPLNDIEYIQCKICNLQFTTTQLHIHMKKHHKNDFILDDVLVEEYQPDIISNKAPKIDIYYVKDRIQSRLVSSTKVEAKN